MKKALCTILMAVALLGCQNSSQKSTDTKDKSMEEKTDESLTRAKKKAESLKEAEDKKAAETDTVNE